MRATLLIFTAVLFACRADAPSGKDPGAPASLPGPADDSSSVVPPEMGATIPNPFPAGTTLGSLMPQVVAASGGRVMASPRVVPITWDNDANRSTIESFFTQYAASTAWYEHVSEYGVGKLTVGSPRHIPGSAPIAMSGASLEQMLAGKLNGTWGWPDSNTIYEFFFPAGSRPTDAADSGKCCVDFDAFHYYMNVQGTDVAYAVVCMCPGYSKHVTDLQELTLAAAHETVEAVTDPFNDAYISEDSAHVAFKHATWGEVADMCQFADTAAWTPPDMTYMVQRSWSNTAAAAGHDPCVGEPASSYYQIIPYLPDTVSVKQWDEYVTAQAAKIPVGETGKVKFTVFVDDPSAGPFDVKVADYASAWQGKPKLLDITVPPGPFAAGETFEVDITVLGQDTDLVHGEEFSITTTPHAGGVATKYFALIGQP